MGTPETTPVGLGAVTALLRSSDRVTKRELIERVGIGRTAVDARLSELQRARLFTETGLAASTGGRAPRSISFNVDAGRVLTAELNSESLAVGVADLSGRILRWVEREVDVLEGPEEPLRIITDEFSALQQQEAESGVDVWAIGVGVLGPVDRHRGRPVPLAELMRAWGDYPVSAILSDTFDVPVWIENEANVIAIGEHRAGLMRGHSEALLVKVSKGIGAGILVGGQLMSGAAGAAGEIGHIAVPHASGKRCWCGNTGCLFTVAGELSLEEDANALARRGESDFLSRERMRGARLRSDVIGQGASRGDGPCIDLLERAGAAVGHAIAGAVNILNPSIVVVTGTVPDASGIVLSSVQRELYAHALSAVATNLPVVFQRPDDTIGLTGAAHLAIDNLFTETALKLWLQTGSPRGIQHQLQPAVHEMALSR